MSVPRSTRFLAATCLSIAVLATVPAVSAAAKPLAVSSSIDGRKELPFRIRWIAHPNVSASSVLEVDFLVDGKVRWATTDAPFVYGGQDDESRYSGYLVTTFLAAGIHRFGVKVTDSDGRVATHTTRARVAAAPEPPADLQGVWTRAVSNADLEKSDPTFGNPPPVGTWKLVFDRVGAWELDSTGAGIVEQYSASPGVLNMYAPIQQDPIVEDHTATARYGAHNIGGNDCSWGGPFGTYRYAVTGQSLTLTATGELCGQRRAILEGTWTRTG
jgi:hypothetical protein